MPEAENQKQKQDQDQNLNQDPMLRKPPKAGGPRRIQPAAMQPRPRPRKKKSKLKYLLIPAGTIGIPTSLPFFFDLF